MPSHPHIDIGFAPQIAQIAAAPPCRAAARSSDSATVFAGRRAPPLPRSSCCSTMITPTPLRLKDRLRGLADRQPVDQLAHLPARSGWRAAGLRSTVAAPSPCRSSSRSAQSFAAVRTLAASAIALPPRRLAGAAAAAERPPARCRRPASCFAGAVAGAPVERPAAGNSRRRRGSAATARRASAAPPPCRARAAAGRAAASPYRRRPPPSPIARIAGRSRKTARPAHLLVSFSARARTSSSCVGLSTARKISATRLSGSLACSLSRFRASSISSSEISIGFAPPCGAPAWPTRSPAVS